jgi:hypothetical protein
MIFGFDPASLLGEAVRAVRRTIEFGFTDVRHVGRILLTGAMAVVPDWGLLDSGGRTAAGGRLPQSRAEKA